MRTLILALVLSMSSMSAFAYDPWEDSEQSAMVCTNGKCDIVIVVPM